MIETRTKKKFYAGIIGATVLIAIVMVTRSGFLIAAELRDLMQTPDVLYVQEIEVPHDIAFTLMARDVLLFALSATCIMLYLRFCMDTLRTNTLFIRKQSRRLLLIGLALLASSGISFVCDSVVHQLLPATVDNPVGIFAFSPWMLVIALFALSLSFIFEYGRLLQEDNDNII